MFFHDVCIPGAMISQTWPKSREVQGATLRAIESVLEQGFYKGIQTVEVPFAEERESIGLLVKKERIPLTYCVSRVLNENKLNLSDLDDNNRKRSYEAVITCLSDAAQMGASAVTFISGPAPEDETLRIKALDKLTDSLSRICYAAQDFPDMKIVIEPLDVHAHKKNTLGFTQEGVKICKTVRAQGLNVYLCLDTAHAYLNGEDPVEALQRAFDFMSEFHFCNCVTDITDPLFGDRHIPFGQPGVLGEEVITGILQRLWDIGFLSPGRRPMVLCEILKREEDDSLTLLEKTGQALTRAWAKVKLGKVESGTQD